MKRNTYYTHVANSNVTDENKIAANVTHTLGQKNEKKEKKKKKQKKVELCVTNWKEKAKRSKRNEWIKREYKL